MGGSGAHYLLRVSVQKSEVDLAAQFLAKGGTLGGAAARGNTSFALSHADTHETFLLTETNQTIDLPLSDKLLARRARSTLRGAHGPAHQRRGGPHVLLSDRTRLNVVSARTGAAINGTLVSTLAGTASVPLLEPLQHGRRQRGGRGRHGQGAAAQRGLHADPDPVPQLGVDQRHARRVRAAGRPRGRRRLGDPRCRRSSSRRRRRRRASAQVQPCIKSIYDAAWQMTKSAKFAPEPNLHKSVMAERDAGFDASGLRARRVGQRHAAGAQARGGRGVAGRRACAGAAGPARADARRAERAVAQRDDAVRARASPRRSRRWRRTRCRTASTARPPTRPRASRCSSPSRGRARAASTLAGSRTTATARPTWPTSSSSRPRA